MNHETIVKPIQRYFKLKMIIAVDLSTRNAKFCRQLPRDRDSQAPNASRYFDKAPAQLVPIDGAPAHEDARGTAGPALFLLLGCLAGINPFESDEGLQRKRDVFRHQCASTLCITVEGCIHQCRMVVDTHGVVQR